MLFIIRWLCYTFISCDGSLGVVNDTSLQSLRVIKPEACGGMGGFVSWLMSICIRNVRHYLGLYCLQCQALDNSVMLQS